MLRLKNLSILCAFTALSGGVLATPAFAQSTPESQLQLLQRQIQQLEGQLRQVQRQIAVRPQGAASSAQQSAEQAQAAAVAAQAAAEAAQKAAPPPLPPGTTLVTSTRPGEFKIGGVEVQLGGFVEANTVYRNKDFGNDLPTPFNSLPLTNSVNAHVSQFDITARNSRLAVGASANLDDDLSVQGYVESDFLATGTGTNANESNSWTPRLRQAWVALNDKANNMQLSAGQMWSMLTLDRSGIGLTNSLQPPVIDAQYQVGYVWARQGAVRLTKSLPGTGLTFGVSLENPQATFFNGSATPTPVINGNAFTDITGASNNSGVVTSLDVAPDLIGKVTYDIGPTHLEGYGILRLFRDRVEGTGVAAGQNNNNVIPGGGFGLATYTPIVPGVLDLQADTLVGDGIGRYGSSQLPDAAVGPFGEVKPIPEVEAMAGLIAHVTPKTDIYGIVGTEQEWATSWSANGKNFGLGNPSYSYAGCGIEGDACTFSNNTSGIVEGSLGVVYKLYHGVNGTVQLGLQYSYLRRNLFEGASGTGVIQSSPRADANMVFTQLRYYPFQ
jgi:hypothetical protein